MRDLETKLYSEQHTKNLLLDEKKKLNVVLSGLKNENQSSSRTINQQKHFNGKREKTHKEMQEEATKNQDELTRLNKLIMDLTWKKDQEKRRLDDKDLFKNQQAKTMALNAENNAVNIDISINNSRILELEGKRDAMKMEINDILTEKRKVDKENMELEHKTQGRGVTEAD